MIKQISVALGLLGLTASAYAAHVAEEMLPVAPPTVPVTIPQQAGSWALGLEALYMSAANGDFNYATTQSIQTGIPAANINSFDFRTHSADAEFEWGGQIDLTYNFEGNGRYVEAAYRRIHGSDTDTTNRDSAGNQFMSGPGILAIAAPSAVSDNLIIQQIQPEAAPFANGWDVARGKTENDYDHIDLVFGQRMDFGQKVTLAAFGGVRYTHIDIEDTANYSADDPAGGAAPNRALSRLKLRSDIHLLGPRAGMDAQVRLGAGISVVGTIAASVLAGDLDKKATVSQRLVDNTGAVVAGRNFDLTAKYDDSTRISPEIDARIGVNYTGSFSPDFAFGFEVGYEATNYFDVKDNSLVSFVDTMGHENDFGLYGLYIRAQLEVA